MNQELNLRNNNYTIKENIDSIKERVSKAAINSGRDAGNVKIIAVTKNVKPELILQAIDAEIVDLGENKVQELTSKFQAVSSVSETRGKNISWHFIGHLQRNKVKYIVDKVKMIHSLDSIELAWEINNRMGKKQKVMDVLVQVNVAEEATKYGIKVDEVQDFICEISKLNFIKVKGLMTIAPKTTDPEEARPVFKELNKIFIDIGRENIDNVNMIYLSMGMSHDFEVAIEEGANMVRLGTSIFGKRMVV